jgi:hypothetical protein
MVFTRLGKPVDNTVDYWNRREPNIGESRAWRTNRNHADIHKLF